MSGLRRSKRISTKRLRDDSETLPLSNTRGLPSLPLELHQEIASYFILPPLDPFHGPVLEDHLEYLRRQRAFMAMAHTCKILRTMYLPIGWDRLEISNDGTSQFLSRLLVRKFTFVTIDEPMLASKICEVSLTLGNYAPRVVFPKLADALALLPNLRVLHIFPSLSPLARRSVAIINECFSAVKLISVLEVSFPMDTFGIVSSCPKASTVICHSAGDWPYISRHQFVDSVVLRQGLHTLRFPPINLGGKLFQKICSELSSLHEVGMVVLGNWMTTASVEGLKAFRKLRILHLKVVCIRQFEQRSAELFNAAVGIFNAIPAKGEEVKKLIIYQRGKNELEYTTQGMRVFGVEWGTVESCQ
ncbi:hypothetical protein EDD18DRAFT_1348565 [Armillaria luteobubalina]|uniref:Uncharacterized protein n=1 Tax=Armillaria luteobubalina TaxID=153913 RepID=A0AA39QDU4_9AGAR|nr:hypothetical protein EDD18DRAFT_1348565 [Armillaria luteobubalina]